MDEPKQPVAAGNPPPDKGSLAMTYEEAVAELYGSEDEPEEVEAPPKAESKPQKPA